MSKQKTIIMLNCLKKNCLYLSNGFGIKKQQWLIFHKTKQNQTKQVLCIRVKMDLRIIAMNEYFTLPRFPGVEMSLVSDEFSVIPKTPLFEGVLPLYSRYNVF